MESFCGNGTAGVTAEQNGDKVRVKQEIKLESRTTHSHLHATESEPEVIHFPEANCTVTINADSDDLDSDLAPEVYFEDNDSHPSPEQNGKLWSQSTSKRFVTASHKPRGRKKQKCSRFTGYNLYCHEKAKEGVTGFFAKEWAKSWAQLSAAERQSYSKRAAQTKRVNVHATLKKILTLLRTLEGAADDTTFAVVGCHQDRFILDGFGPAYDALEVQSRDLRQSMLKKSFAEELEEDYSAGNQSVDSCIGLRDILQKKLNKLAEDVLGYKHFPYKRAERGEVIVEGVPKDLLPLRPPALLNLVEMRRLIASTIYISVSAENLTEDEDMDSSEPAVDDSSHSRSSGMPYSQTDRQNHVERTDFLHAKIENDGHVISAMDVNCSSSNNRLLGFPRVKTDLSGQDTATCEDFTKSSLHCAGSGHRGSSSSHQAAQKKEMAEDEASDAHALIRPKAKTWRLAPVKKKEKLPKTPKERQRKEYVRHIWTIPEKEVLQRHFLEMIKRGRFPSKKEIQDLIVAEPLLHRRTWKKIDNFLRSQHG